MLMQDYRTMKLDPTHNEAMLAILAASPINANGLQLYFDKSPDLFTIPQMKYSSSEHLGMFKGDEFKGFGSLGYFDALVQGQPENVFSFYNFYLLPEARGTQIVKEVARDFFSSVRGKANYGISITLKGNRPAESYIGKKIADWYPPNRIIDELVVKSIFFALPKKNTSSYKIRNACLEDIPDIVRLLQAEHAQRDFGIPFHEDTFLANLANRKLSVENYYVATTPGGKIKGVCLAWDCSAFRRPRVLSYSSKFYPTLWTYAALEKILPLAPFPAAGECFNELTITDYAVTNRDPVIMHALLCEIYHRHYKSKYHFIQWASCGSDPLLQAANGLWHKNMTSHIIFNSMDPERYHIQPHLPYIDIAFI